MPLGSNLAFFDESAADAIDFPSDGLTIQESLSLGQPESEGDQQHRRRRGEPVQRPPAVGSCVDQSASEDSSEELVHVSIQSSVDR